MTFKIGDLVIINHIDKPCAALISVVTGFGTEFVKAHYVTEYPNMRTCSSDPSNVTKLEDFGIDAEITEDTIRCIKRRPSIAEYANGKQREWQGLDDETRSLRKEVMKYLK